MKNIILGVILIISIMILVGCQSQEITCNKPYIKVGTSCCLDENNNAICDKDEVTSNEDGNIQQEELVQDPNPQPEEQVTSLSKKDCVDELTIITAAVNILVEDANNVIYSLNGGIITASTFKSKLNFISEEFKAVERLIKTKKLDSSCPSEVKNRVIIPLISVSNLYARSYKEAAKLSSKESLMLSAQWATEADLEKTKIESYLKANQNG